MTAADLAARQAAAAPALADYKRELATAPLSRPPGREWMLRLATELESLLTALEAACEREGSHLITDGTAGVFNGEDLLTVLGALPDAAAWCEHTGQRRKASKYRRVLHSIGDDR